MSMDNLAAMAVFAKVVEANGFSAAARDLGLSKSAVSKHVSRLEDRLGARLLNRTTRRLALTEIGEAFYERCTRLVAEAEEAELAVTRMSAEPSGMLRVNMPFSFGSLHVVPSLCGFMGAYPRVNVQVTLDDRYADLVADGYDLAIRIGELDDSSLIARRLAITRPKLVASPAYWARHGVPRVPADLSAHECLVYTYLRRGPLWRFGDQAVRIAGRLQANNGDVLRQAALAGHGVALLPSFIVWRDLHEGRLVPALEAYCEDPLGIYAIYPHSRHLSAKVRAFIDFLAARFGERPYWEEVTPEAGRSCPGG
ncbi:MAG: LysR family transcriptional regulator [Alphaproteobacteria bacterium]